MRGAAPRPGATTLATNLPLGLLWDRCALMPTQPCLAFLDFSTRRSQTCRFDNRSVSYEKQPLKSRLDCCSVMPTEPRVAYLDLCKRQSQTFVCCILITCQETHSLVGMPWASKQPCFIYLHRLHSSPDNKNSSSIASGAAPQGLHNSSSLADCSMQTGCV